MPRILNMDVREGLVKSMPLRIIEGDVRVGLATLADNSVHAVVTSPPY